ncbi:glycosyltransferase family 2 protein [Haloferax volcanii]|uniref:Glycosyltransferase n=3 Tax=Haloferax volcanii TaxID=2246 RepID=A0A558G953_HALVO|nr:MULTISPECIES: glycosyltransferase [Haloferax]ELZ72509.1 glycosyl transferase family protein [Haloferax lucentense DSM 14919]ELZ92358.1 glycosyl transferase family protein [Haloferax alexandrinus JCM 10717]NLV01713.1 glycosyltransferase [Haloferax alexandrinus]TVT94292.1 glycosyltransferase [Haloferax volcanii]
MDLSVVLPTLNGRDRLATSLDALAEHAPDAEVVVVNGPSADGTTGMVRERDDVDVLVEISDRNLNVARNAGLEVAGGDVVALLRYDLSVESSWLSALEAGIDDADVVTGPMHQTLRNGMTTESLERNAIGGRTVTYFNGGNVAFRRGAIDALDGFDEYLQTGGARDAAHRLAGFDRSVAWAPEMCVRREFEADGGVSERDWGWKYRSLTYRLVKNYGIRPGTVKRTVTHAVSDGVDAALGVLRGDVTPSGWVGTGRDVVGGIATGVSDGLVARARDRTRTRNPHGRSKRADRAVARYDRR